MNQLTVSPFLSYYSSPLLLSKRFLKVCSLPSPKPRTRRPNHLRRKTLIPKPQPLQYPAPPPPPQQLPADELQFVVLEEEVIAVERVNQDVDAAEVVEEAALATVGTDPLASPADLRWLPREVIGLALRFAALIVVQTVVAVWFFGGFGGEEENRSGALGMEEGRVGRALSEELELEKKVLEIRAMAKEARETERRELAEDSGVKGEVEKKLCRFRKSATKVILDENSFSVSLPVPSKNVDDDMDREQLSSKRNIGREKINSKRKLGFLNSIKRTGNVPKGFNDSRSNGEREKDGSGGVEQIAEEASRHHDQVDLKACASGMTQGFSNIKDFAASSSQGAVGRVSSGHRSNASSVLEENENEGTLSYGETNFTCDDNQEFLKNPSGESSVETIRTSSTESPNEKNEHRSFMNKDEENHLVAIKKPWWLKLPYVIAILLRRGSDGTGPKGLYSLEINSSTGEENASYTIAFQDRQDATNFCYLLESFFDDLGDVTADIVPLTIEISSWELYWDSIPLFMVILIFAVFFAPIPAPICLSDKAKYIMRQSKFFSTAAGELEQAVKSDALKVIVVRKGQIRLYAGQPLVEVETEIRSLLD